MKRLAILLSSTVLVSCGFDDRVAGGTSSEVPNALHGTVLNDSGKPVANCAVRVAASSSWIDSTGSVDSTVTDENGQWKLAPRKRSESVTILFRTAKWASLARLSLDTTGSSATRQDTLRGASWVRGALVGARGLSKIALLGTDIHGTTDSSGRFIIGPLPSGDLHLLFQADSVGTAARRIESITTRPGDTSSVANWTISGTTWATEDYGTWPRSRTATLDMTSSGAASTGDHVGFPVPVRLDTLIDFRTVKPGELRFDDGNRLHYPYQVEQWDSAAGKALVWVRLDTANGSSDKHSLRMHWGMAGAKAPIDMPRVFDGSNGFAAVWHQTSAIDTSLGISLAWKNSATVVGILGNAQAFAETGSYMTDSVELGKGHSWTVGLWIRLDKKPSGESLLVGFADGPDSTKWGVSVRDDQVVRVWSGSDSSRSLEATTPLALGVWTHLAATFEYTKQRIGLVVDATSYSRQTVLFPAASRQRIRGMTGLSGAVDEIRLSNTERPVEWPELERKTGAAGVPWLKWK